MSFLQGLLGGIVESATGIDLNGDGRIGGGRGRGRGGGLMQNILSLFGPMAFLPAPRISEQELRKYRGGVNPIVPYTAPNPYKGGRCKGLFIGINYRGLRSELSGCINDVTMMLDTLKSINFPLQEVCILVDDPNFKGCGGPPTRENIIRHMQWLVYQARPGDCFFFHYSGHGSQVRDEDGDEEDGMDETLVPLDYESAGCIVDDDIYKLLVTPLPPGARLTAVMDCCHSGTLMDLTFVYAATTSNMNSPIHIMRPIRPYNPNIPVADVVMFSGCDDDQTSADVSNAASFGNINKHGRGTAGGACTNALSAVLTKTTGLTYFNLLLEMRKILRQKRYEQVPQLSSSKPIDMNKPFSLFGPVDQSGYLPYVPMPGPPGYLPNQPYPPPPPVQPYPQSRSVPPPLYGPPQPQGGYPGQYRGNPPPQQGYPGARPPVQYPPYQYPPYR